MESSRGCLVLAALHFGILPGVGMNETGWEQRRNWTDEMPRVPRRALLWSTQEQRYEAFTQGQFERCVPPTDDAALLTWLGEDSSFAFHGRSGSLNVYLERRPRGGSYWYAYHTDRHGIRKRYLGQTAQVTLARLEATALAMASAAGPAMLPDASALPDVEPPLSLPVLLATKLTPPRLPRALVERPRLLSVLDEALATPLTLLSAAAGWGKTTLLATWANRQRRQVISIAWLSLDELDNSPTRFWVAVIASLRRTTGRAPDLGATALALLQSPQPPPLSACLAALLQDLEDLEDRAGTGQPTPIVVVLDDYQVISDPAIHESLTFWLEHLPGHVHVVLASRVDPDLPLARLRVRGQLTELRAGDLHFRPAETNSLLQQAVGSALPEEEVAALQRRTEGWAAGLQLAALSLRQHQQQDDRSAWIAAWTGSQRYLLDYVQEEILSRQPDDLQRFLLHTAVLTRLSAPVCQAVLAAPEAQTCQRILETLERVNLFVVPLDEERRWYRVHDLFREALLARLAVHEPSLLLQLHLRAADWYEAAGDLQEAIAHALAAPDYLYAARLMERTASALWLRGEAQTVQGWMAVLPDAVLWQHAPLALQATLSLLESLHNTTEAAYARAQAAVVNTLARLEALLRQHAADQEGASQRTVATAPTAPSGLAKLSEELLVNKVIGRRLRLLRALIEARECLRRGNRVHLALLAEELEQLCQGEDITWQMVARRLDFWLTEAFEHEGATLIARLVDVREQAEQAGDLLARLRVRAWLAHLQVHAAQWPQVEQECLAGLALVAQSGVRTAWEGYLQSSLAEAYYAWNRLDEAVGALHEELRIAEEWQRVDLLIDSRLNLAQAHLARGELAAADQALHQAEALVQREPFAHLLSTVAAFRVRYWLAAGDLEAAHHWAEQVAFSPDRWDQNDFLALLMLIRVHLAQRQHPQALDLLERFHAQLDQPGNIWRTVEWLPVYVVALHQAGHREQLRPVLSRLLALTEPTGSLRVYLDQGEPMRQALQAFCSAPAELQEQAPPITALVARLLAAFKDEASGASRSRIAAPALAPMPALASATSAADIFLTRREQEVLRLLADGASNQDIAQTLVISLATVKKHVSNLIGKLGATSRAQAVAQARIRSLL
jgi:LuxR family transcriptional regulator, maltose regulon positive regulatory protein